MVKEITISVSFIFYLFFSSSHYKCPLLSVPVEILLAMEEQIDTKKNG